MSLSLDIDLQRGDFRLTLTANLPPRGLTAIFGQSGAGKSTLLRAIAGFQPCRGRIALGPTVWQGPGRFVPPHRRRIGFVFQEARLFPHLDVRGNLTYAARRAGRMAALEATADQFGLTPLLSRAAPDLSGGEAQRVAIARAILTAPQLLLMDEPLSALDAAARAELLPLIEALRDRGDLPILYVSHALPEVVRLAGHTLALGAGRVLAFGPTQAVLGDGSADAALDPDGPGSLLVVRHDGAEADGLSRLSLGGTALYLPAITTPPGQELRLLVRARDVMIARARPEGISALNILPALVTAIAPAGQGQSDVHLSVAGQDLRARITIRSVAALALTPGVECHAILKSVALAQGAARSGDPA